MEAFMICGQDESQNYPQGTERADELKKHHFEKREERKDQENGWFGQLWFPFYLSIYLYMYEVPGKSDECIITLFISTAVSQDSVSGENF